LRELDTTAFHGARRFTGPAWDRSGMPALHSSTRGRRGRIRGQWEQLAPSVICRTVCLRCCRGARSTSAVDSGRGIWHLCCPSTFPGV